MSKIDSKFEYWKKQLLDLTNRNKLLNFKEESKSSLLITSPSCFELYEKIVDSEDSIFFPQFLEEDEYENEDNDGDVDDINEEDDIVEFYSVKTNKTPKELIRVLRSLRSKAKTAIEEQGINMLYLCFGFLRWTESDVSTQTKSAPLILVPVSLTVESVNSPFELHLHEDEIVLNPTLIYKLESEYGITLPPYDENSSLEDFFESVRNNVSRMKGWSIAENVGLGILSFLKISMYEDLNKNKETILANPIIRAVAGDSTAASVVSEGISEYGYDKQDIPKNNYQVLDADASQQQAIAMAKSGVSFVLQGPPGTGKSQTITNIIAESIANGKKVLFVSEKMAALEVVYKRLSEVGLDDFCLVLHSHKASKRAVLDQLEKVLSLSSQRVILSNNIYEKLDLLQRERDFLNDYSEQVYAKVMPLGFSIYDVNGKIAELNNSPDLIFRINNIRETSREQYIKYCNTILGWKSVIEKMPGDFRDNPWNNSILKTITFEFRHDAGIKLSTLSENLKSAALKFKDVKASSHIEYPTSIDGMKQTISLIEALNGGTEIPNTWLFATDIENLFDEVEVQRGLQQRNKDIINEIKANWANIDTSIIGPLPDICSLTLDEIKDEKRKIQDILYTKSPFSLWRDRSKYEAAKDLFFDSAKKQIDLRKLESELLKDYEDTIIEVDDKPIRERIKTEYGTSWRWLKKSYTQDKKEIQKHRKEIVKKLSHEEFCNTVEKIHQIREIKDWYLQQKEQFDSLLGNSITENTELLPLKQLLDMHPFILDVLNDLSKLQNGYSELDSNSETLVSHYHFMFKGMQTDWDYVKNSLNWANQLKKAISKTYPGNEFVEAVCSSNEFRIECVSNFNKVSLLYNTLLPEYTWFSSLFDEAEDFGNMDLECVSDRTERCSKNMSSLEEWIDYADKRQKCIDIGLSDFTDSIESNKVANDDILPAFQKRFFRLWLDSVLPEYPAVAQFRRRVHEEVIKDFSEHDTEQFGIAAARIKAHLIKSLPSLDRFSSGLDETSILKRELKKQRKIMPLRKLFKEIPNLLLTLKPCLMMSPLSVSLFLEADTYKFDIVIFDEASQVYPENAIGAISRAKQVVIAGDNKQLPPSNFFKANTETGDDEFDDNSEEDVEIFESILDEANMLPERTLQWHYRSRHESLIAFSNAKIYKNRLITFPSNIEEKPGIGVEYIFVKDGFYNRGGKNGNVPEAKKVASLVYDHFATTPDRSLGVIAFGENQQIAIENEIRALRLRDPKFEYLFSEAKEEPFFVKNLENVQGDERDTIIFSIGYAKDERGVFRNQFGPLSSVGGERRLNVAITRAKYNVKLVGSIMPTDIDIEKISNEGPKLLKSYIDYAINGQTALARAITENDLVQYDSPFEESVYNFLDRKGYKVVTQVGCSGYRIDMAVKHPTLNGVYVIGIECDGAQYHSAKTARERDRLRQDVLENMGWTIYRIWSTDWIKDTHTEGEKLVEAVEKAIENYRYVAEKPRKRTITKSNDVDTIQTQDYISLEKNNTQLTGQSLYGFEDVVPYSLDDSHLNIQALLELIVKNEYPIHIDVLCQRLAKRFGRQKATSEVRYRVDCLLYDMEDKVKKIEDTLFWCQDYIYPCSFDKIHIRLPNARKIEHISSDELKTAMLTILGKLVGATKESLVTETARVYGFKRTGDNIQYRMSKVVENLILSKQVKEENGKLFLPN